ncbi:MAG: hypothetical protein OMM_05843 [Candidatus Magnetoglobus multicellularis str. Araruama]|uniref:Uncharacterized protein n=1 Tax=Candidatus Magnetoglobus multicellularis str. Araruama TaxID=890399 RepID=A0A1V1NTU9_9BACT|nr:MAG: hypothetical protein OMM_05843 [Candidatus Magnetoglobus multicellularis str. Araruama]
MGEDKGASYNEALDFIESSDLDSVRERLRNYRGNRTPAFEALNTTIQNFGEGHPDPDYLWEEYVKPNLRKVEKVEDFKPTRVAKPAVDKKELPAQNDFSINALTNNHKKSRIVSDEINKSKFKTFLTQYTPEEIINNSKAIILNNSHKKAGAVVTKENDITSVFNNSGVKDEGKIALIKAIEAGGETLDHIDGKLSKIYEEMGFEETRRMKWNDEYAPENWNYEKDGRPDIIFRKLNQEKYEQFKNGHPEFSVRSQDKNWGDATGGTIRRAGGLHDAGDRRGLTTSPGRGGIEGASGQSKGNGIGINEGTDIG